jgi:hypothetical protein
MGRVWADTVGHQQSTTLGRVLAGESNAIISLDFVEGRAAGGQVRTPAVLPVLMDVLHWSGKPGLGRASGNLLVLTTGLA